MDNFYLIVHFLLTAVAAGVIGTLGMTSMMHLINYSGLTNSDMVRAIGSIFTRSLDSAWLVGILLHIISGVSFAVLYTLGFMLIGVHGAARLTAVGSSFGAAHGFCVSFILVVTVARHHPLKEFRDTGSFVAAAHFFGHVVYGMLVGMVVGLSGFSIG